MSINWQNLRPWNGSQHSAFEELCCQLARYDQIPQGSNFVRKGTPDAGIECYWQLPSGDIWGWQAKFFLSSPDESQWRQIDDSVKTAIEKHTRLTRLIICLPVDRSDPHIENQKWFMDKWNDHVAKWQKWVNARHMSTEFDYWGEHEIWERLSLDEHRGRHFFWFNEESFSGEWLESRISEAVANVGPRYTPELNVKLPIARLFEGLGRTTDFFNHIKISYGEISRAYKKSLSNKAENAAKNEFTSLSNNINALLSHLKDVENLEIRPIDFDLIGRLASQSSDNALQCERKLIETAENLKKQFAAEKQEDGQSSAKDHESEFGYARHHLYELIRHLDELNDFARSHEARLANIPALLLAGDAGTGKTHLFCDVAKQRVAAKLPTLLLLGGQFSDEEPWSQMIRLLGLSCTREELLGALESSAIARGAKVLILIDALNEGEGKKLWLKYFAGLLTVLSRHPWIGIAVSVRTSYTQAVVPDGLIPNRLIHTTHRGFSDHEYQATRTFFSYFGLERPSVPLLVPEFQNPLFLKLFCQGLKNRGLTKVPPGLQGITAIFDFFIDSINSKLSQSELLDFDPKSKPVQKAVEKLVEQMADRGQTWLPRDETQTIINSILPRNGYDNSLFRHMISEGLLAEDRYRSEDAQWREGIHFSYERFSDHLIAKYLLDKHLDAGNPSLSFQPDKVLGSLIKDEGACWENRGIVEAFIIQIPERVNCELTALVPSIAEYQPIREAFIQSLIWREPSAITDPTLQYINSVIIQYKDSHDQFLNALLTVTANPKHPYNADFLHKRMMKSELAERDAWWSVFLHYQYGEHGAVDRLLEWAWSDEDKSHIEDESLRLSGLALVWFLTTSNRYLRDRATKALVGLLEKRIPVLRQILVKFVSVNDPYVLERLFAVAYGCAMRSADTAAIGELAKDVYKWIFKDGTPPPHILLRDYARGVIETALHRGVALDIDVKKIRPPYKSEWPSFDIPPEDEIKKYGEWQDKKTDAEKALSSLYYSVMGSSDFARYVIGTNSGHFDWTTHRLGKRRKPTKREIYDNFVRELTKKQDAAWRKYLDARHQAIKIVLSMPGKEKQIIRSNNLSDKENQRHISKTKQAFCKTLNVEQRKTFEKYVENNIDRSRQEEARFDLSVAQRWIFMKVLDLGWTAERFGEFDWNLNRYSDYGRESRKSERIGKKYQWIAYYEFLARVSDNFEFKGDPWSDRKEKYEGPWQIGYIRNIDPSCSIKSTNRQEWQAHSNTWWFPLSYDTWDSEPDDVKWLKTNRDLPPIEPLLEVVNPSDNSKWLVMEAYYRYEQPTPIEEDRFELPRRDIYYMIKSYIVKKSDIGKLFDWATNQNFMGRWMPEAHSLYRVMLGEFYWSPAFLYHDIPYYSHDGWNQGTREKLPKKVLVSADQYTHESNSYDCSIDETINIDLPAKWLADHMGLRWNGVEGHYFDRSGKLIAFDPSVRSVGPGALLINRDALLEFLNQNGYEILWTVLGEKNFIGGGLSVGNWKGRLEINGAYRIYKNKIKGKLNAKYLSRD